ncbi:hypothetical protein BJX65DRAFT_309868 [Aspergillus insuetus]
MAQNEPTVAVTRRNFTTEYHHDTYERLQARLPNAAASGKSVFLTGAGKGIGISIALAFARAGPRVIFLCGRTRATLEETRAKILRETPTIRAEVIVVDISKGVAECLRALAAARTFDSGRPVDILINNAAYLASAHVVGDDDSVAHVQEQFEANWKHYEVNVKGSLALATAFLRNCVPRNPVIINISSGAAVLDYVPGIGCYASSKLATLKMYSDLGFEETARGSRIFHLHPGSVQTAMSAPGARSPDTAELSADFAVWLTSPEAQFLHNRLIYANWDVDELLAKKPTIVSRDYLKIGVTGWDSTAYSVADK